MDSLTYAQLLRHNQSFRRLHVMIATDLLRVAVAVGPLLVRRPQDLWIAYVCTALAVSSTSSARRRSRDA